MITESASSGNVHSSDRAIAARRIGSSEIAQVVARWMPSSGGSWDSAIATLRPSSAAADGAVALECSCDGSSLGLALDIADDRVVRVPGNKAGHEDRVDISLAVAGGKPIAIVVYPGTAIAREKILAPAKTSVA